jgi:broad-specificity NMP kinase
MNVPNYKLTKIAENILSDIQDLVNLEELYSETEILLHVKENYNPEDVFSEAVLSDWAFENGYRKLE